MLTENDVIEILIDYLKKDNYSIESSKNTNQIGVDIISVKNQKRLYIEAKGETSSKEGTNRFGMPFSNNQVSTHIAMAILYAMLELNKPENLGIEFAFAFPDNAHHRNMIKKIYTSIQKLGIKIFWVSSLGVVTQ